MSCRLFAVRCTQIDEVYDLQKVPDVILKMAIIDSHCRSEMDSFVGVRSDVKLGMEGTGGSGEV